MLERAASCIEPRFWCSRATRKCAYRSARLLHSAFWSHGAADVEIPPYALDLCRDTPAASRTSGLTTSERKGSARTDKPILDFLYPQQALALLQRQSFGTAEGRKRSAHGARKYSSAPPQVGTSRPPVGAHGGSAKAAPRDDTRPLPRFTWQQEPGNTHDKSIEGLNETTLENAALAASQDQSGIGRVQALYKSMPEHVRESTRVIQNLLVWMETIEPDESVQQWQKQLMGQMPTEDYLPDNLWTPAYCLVAVKQHILAKNLERAYAIVHGAISRRLRGDFGAPAMMQYLLGRRRWVPAAALLHEILGLKDRRTMAMLIPDTALSRLADYRQEPYRKTIVQLTRFIRADEAAVLTPEIEQLLARLTMQYASILDNTESNAKFKAECAKFRRLMDRIETHVPPRSTVFERVLNRLLDVKQPRDRHAYTSLVAGVWKQYSLMPMFRPTDSLMVRLLQAWNTNRLDHETPVKTHNSKTRMAFAPHSIQSILETVNNGLDYVPRSVLMSIYAQRGDVEKVEGLMKGYMESLGAEKPNPDLFWAYLQTYVTRRDSQAAWNAFQRISTEYGVEADQRSWDMLQHAFMAADDLDGAVEVFEGRLESGVPLTAHAISSLMVIYSRRGDPDAVLSLTKLADDHSVTEAMHMRNALLLAYANAGDVAAAMEVFDRTIKDHGARTISGPLTMVFNSALSVRAKRREYMEFFALYGRMRELAVPMDSDSYACVIQALVMRRNNYEAWDIISKIMPEANVVPTAFHYATMIGGYIKTAAYTDAIRAWNHMLARGIEPTIGARALYLKAKALQERDVMVVDQNGETGGAALDDTTQELLSALDQPRIYRRTAEFGMRNVSPEDAETPLFESLIHLHGRQHSFDAAWQLFQKFHERKTAAQIKSDEKQDEAVAPAFRLTTAMISVYFRAGQLEEVTNCWGILYEQATALAKVKYPKVKSDPLALDFGETSLGDKPSSIKPGRRFLLAMPFRYYSSAILTSPQTTPQDTTALIELFLQLLSAGWQFDHLTWNTLIQKLCAMSPTRALFAFTLTERYLTPHFPGWQYPRQVLTNTFGRPNASRVASGVQYMSFPHRHVAPGQRLPTYSTMVYLAHALLELRRIEAAGLNEGAKDLRAQIGSIRDITRRCPATLAHVRNLPVVLDPIQRRLIRRGNDIDHDSRWFGSV